jgi:predicted metal-dependent phosphotriesterase family hydrolase
VVADKIIIVHLDRKPGWNYHLQIAVTGVYLDFYQISEEKYYADADRIVFIRRLVQDGYSRQTPHGLWLGNFKEWADKIRYNWRL